MRHKRCNLALSQMYTNAQLNYPRLSKQKGRPAGGLS